MATMAPAPASAYVVESFTERERPDLAYRAHQIQGESYLAEGYVNAEALTSDGRLRSDRTRGPNVTYFLAMDPAGHAHATARVVGIPAAGWDIEALPGYRRSQHRLDAHYVRLLADAVATCGPSAVVELAALAKTTAAPSIASFEVMRAIYQRLIQAPGGPLICFALLVPNSYRSLCRNFGTHTFQRAGADISIADGDPCRATGLRATPVVSAPGEVLDGVLESACRATDAQATARYLRGLTFLANGLPDEHLSPAVRAALGARPASGGGGCCDRCCCPDAG